MVARGSVCWVELDKRRPCVVVSSQDVLNAEVWQVHVVPLTSNVERANLAGNILLAEGDTALSKASVAVPLGLELVDRSWLSDETSQLSAQLMEQLDKGLKAVVGL